MEFSIFVQTFLPGAQAHDPAAEHRRLLGDLEIIRFADRCGFKYAWVSEHHCLTEYSHLSASESFIPFALAQTQRIHVGSGIWPLNPVTNHPVRLAERAAMCDHLSEGRFELGTGRGAGTWEIGTFGLRPSETKAIWEEVIGELAEMWGSVDYSHDGEAFATPPRNVLPKPYGGGRTHPPLWVAAANPSTYERAGRRGLGVLGFNVGSIYQQQEMVEVYKTAIVDAEPAGRYVNDNVMVTNGSVVCLADGRQAREWAARMGLDRVLPLLYLYHDTFPTPEGAPRWPDTMAPPTLDEIDAQIEGGFMCCGTPEELVDQIRRYEAVGVDQLAFTVPFALPDEIVFESLRQFGENVIPHFDKDPVHRSSRMRYGDRADELVSTPGLAAGPIDSGAIVRTGVTMGEGAQ